MKKIAITMGDAAGIGPEIIAKALYCAEIRDFCAPLVIGGRSVMEEAISLLKLPLKLRIINSPDESKADRGIIELVDIGKIKKFEKGKPAAENGRACVSYIKKAVELALNKKVDGIVTAPISKEALKLAGFKWPGHTEMLAEFTDAKDYAMMLVGGQLRVILVTIHTSLKSVPEMIKKEGVLKTILLAKKACDMLDIKNPKIAVAGLNPHAGEAGIFGDEEKNEIIPAIEEAKKLGMPVTGPYPPDTVFHGAYKAGIDIVVCMYHDQGLIPLKMIAFEEGVNVTVGLPLVRTSPDHGTAYDIAWKGIANPASMLEAIKLAVKLKI
ncbi:MAG: 4-hydroxythreonine-4-phosphate dehydrogenase PdxA [Nitrospirae bacterium GWF2_44_13]|nr:MAG: 4-hydroxythreonine-4-phosphate dehydrogenase PdxA [Nitrospirae bacterium GWF2_44_13]OGW65321.1 MAG: 4-hydroxythreonine-4-phosphate dehydrogenase PdxA [Nitrospirae bacterium RIFOXYA2_FULL_44_9]HBG93391.1 4-hydroxythreonine-4-phosphate dehydrogenase PdxA [Nitrospiraceae bacterium]